MIPESPSEAVNVIPQTLCIFCILFYLTVQPEPAGGLRTSKESLCGKIFVNKLMALLVYSYGMRKNAGANGLHSQLSDRFLKHARWNECFYVTWDVAFMVRITIGISGVKTLSAFL